MNPPSMYDFVEVQTSLQPAGLVTLIHQATQLTQKTAQDPRR